VHICEAKRMGRRNYRQNWIRSLLDCFVEPVMSVLEEGCGEGWVDAEKKWIGYYRESGIVLVNGTDGGDGACNPSAEVRAKISLANRGKTVTTETREKLANASRGRPCTQDARIKISMAKKGKSMSFESRIKMSAAQKGKTLTQEHREKIALSNRGNPKSPEHQGKIASRNKSQEQRLRLSELFKGRRLSEEQKNKISASRTGTRLSPESLENRRLKMKEKRLSRGYIADGVSLEALGAKYKAVEVPEILGFHL